MSADRTCPECGSELPPGVEPWLCPKCLLGQAANDASAKPAGVSTSGPTEPPPVGEPEGLFPQPFGKYELLERIGLGGMGIVYRARQMSLDRIVAVKVLPHGALATKEQVLRFRTEAAAAGSLQHPNIVAIHEVGLCEDRHYMVMDFVEGQTLAELVRAGPLSPRRAARYVQTIAEAVHHAHEHGILHRDLKPSNVLIDAADQPRITDFGLAKRLESGTDLTLSGQVLGSPQYMAPEQAAGRQRQVGRRSDLYALGAMLYHLLTGRPPFVGETLSDILPQVANDEPLRPRQLNPAVPLDLETICLKCLEKEMSRRYPTALALAEELSRFLCGEPIVARPVGVAGKVWRWCRRKPQAATLAAVAILTFLLGFAGVVWQWRQAESQRQRAEVGEAAARRQGYISDINAAQAALKDNNPARALELLNRSWPSHSALATGASLPAMDLRGFEWRYLWQQCQTEAEALVGRLSSRINSLEVSRDGRWLVAASDSGAVKLWNLSTGEEIPLAPDGAWPNYATFSPDSRLVLLTDQTLRSQGTVIAWDIKDRKRLAPVYRDTFPVGTMAFSGDGRWLWIGVVGTNADAPTPNITTSAAARTSWRKRMVFLESPGWNKTRELSFRSPQVYMNKGLYGVFTADNRSVIYPETEPVCQLARYDFVAGAKPSYFPAHNEGITAMAISPDGRLLATGSGYSDTVIRLWEVPSMRSVGELRGHAAWIAGLKFSRDGRTLVSASADQTIRLWSMATKEATRIYRGMAAEPSLLCLSPSDDRVFSGGVDGTVFRWPAVSQPAQPPRGPALIETGLKSIAALPGCAQCAGIREGSVYLGDVQPDASPTRLPALGTNNDCLLFSPQQHFLFAGNWNGMVQVWSLADHRIQASLRGAAEPVCWLGQDLRGSILVAVHWHLGTPSQLSPAPYWVSVWSTANWQPRKVFTIPGVSATYAVSPDGNFLAAGAGLAGNLQVWNLGDPGQTSILTLPGDVRAVAFSPDGKRLAAATLEGTVRIWEVPAFRPRGEFRAAPGALLALAFSPDARRLVTACARAGSLQVWDVATWQPLITLESPRAISRAEFSLDGNQLMGVSGEGDLLCWRVPSFAEIAQRDKLTSSAQ